MQNLVVKEEWIKLKALTIYEGTVLGKRMGNAEFYVFNESVAKYDELREEKKLDEAQNLIVDLVARYAKFPPKKIRRLFTKKSRNVEVTIDGLFEILVAIIRLNSVSEKDVKK